MNHHSYFEKFSLDEIMMGSKGQMLHCFGIVDQSWYINWLTRKLGMVLSLTWATEPPAVFLEDIFMALLLFIICMLTLSEVIHGLNICFHFYTTP